MRVVIVYLQTEPTRVLTCSSETTTFSVPHSTIRSPTSADHSHKHNIRAHSRWLDHKLIPKPVIRLVGSLTHKQTAFDPFRRSAYYTYSTMNSSPQSKRHECKFCSLRFQSCALHSVVLCSSSSLMLHTATCHVIKQGSCFCALSVFRMADRVLIEAVLTRPVRGLKRN